MFRKSVVGDTTKIFMSDEPPVLETLDAHQKPRLRAMLPPEESPIRVVLFLLSAASDIVDRSHLCSTARDSGAGLFGASG